MERIYHHYEMWEDWKYGFYDNCSGNERKEKIKEAISLFESESLTREYMFKVVDEWIYSCEHNLTNNSLNRIAYIGQAACCLFSNIPNDVTMEAWNTLSKDVQERSNNIAKKAIDKWLNNNKNIQLCLNIF